MSSWAIELFLRGQIQHLFCEVALPHIQTLINSFLVSQLDVTLQRLIANGTASELPVYDHSVNYVNWGDVLNRGGGGRHILHMKPSEIVDMMNPVKGLYENINRLMSRIWGDNIYKGGESILSWGAGYNSDSVNTVDGLFQCMIGPHNNIETAPVNEDMVLGEILINGLMNRLTNGTGEIFLDLSELHLSLEAGNKSITILDVTIKGKLH
jgi:hypothetical protein